MEFGEEVLEPVSPNGQYFSSSVITLSVLAVLEFETPIEIDQTQTMSLLKKFLSIPRFSSIMVENNGKKQWKRVEVKLEDHVNIPIFPSNESPESYDKYLGDYISKLSIKRFSQDKPLWEIHIIKYPTTNAAGNIIFNIHHAIGDGYSLMGALLTCLQRADNPSLPLTFPSRQRSKPNNENFRTKIYSWVSNTTSDFWSGISKRSMNEDDRTPIKSGNDALEFQPSTVSTMTFSLDQIKSIKDKLGVTVNDVLTGMIFFGSRLYMQEINQNSSKADCSAMVLQNTRIMGGNYMSIEEMIKPDSKMPWGNRFTFLHVPIPQLTERSNALEFIWEAHKIIKRKRNSLVDHFNSRLLQIVNKFGGHEAASGYIHSTLKNSSMVISNMIGPTEQMSLANHPIKGLYFLVPGFPQGFDVTIVSYMGKVRLAFKMEKGLIDPQRFKSCLENSFEMLLKESNKYSSDGK